MFEKSILVVAHPDDEILWFSSIVYDVDAVIICFLDVPSNPAWTEGRHKSIPELPIESLSCLGLDESEAFNGADWRNPVISKQGLEISNNVNRNRLENYKNNYKELLARLKPLLSDYKNVFTHNPWGEYGHEEHVQVYRAVKYLQGGMHFNLWFSNYCSNKSFSLMQKYINGFDSNYKIKKTNKELAEDCMHIYKNNDCWTWYDDYQWFNEEYYMLDAHLTAKMHEYGHLFPLNMLKIEAPWDDDQSKTGLCSRIKNILRRSGICKDGA